MFKSVTTVVVTAALLLSGTAFAQQTATRADAPVGQIQITAKPLYKPAPQEFNDYAYRYNLSTGDTVTLRQKVGRYFVRMNNAKDVEIFGQRPGVFLSNTGTRLEFHDAGDMVLLTNAGTLPGASPALAAMPAESVQMAAR
jgi:N-acetylmuramoyl-L-alanine amidase CwlA